MYKLSDMGYSRFYVREACPTSVCVRGIDSYGSVGDMICFSFLTYTNHNKEFSFFTGLFKLEVKVCSYEEYPYLFKAGEKEDIIFFTRAKNEEDMFLKWGKGRHFCTKEYVIVPATKNNELFVDVGILYVSLFVRSAKDFIGDKRRKQVRFPIERYL